MAFVRVEHWEGEPIALCAAPAEAAPARSVSRRGAVLLSLAVHAVLTWLVAGGLSGSAGGEGPAADGGAIQIFDLAQAAPGAAAAAEPAPAPQPPPPPPQPAEQTEVDLGTRSSAPPPEWTATRIAVPIEAPAPAAPAQLAAAAPGAAPAGTAGGGGYDPFAGAAPLRRPEAQALPAAGSAGAAGWQLDMAAFRAAIASVRPGRAAGSVEWRARLSAEGEVVAIDLTGGTASEPVKRALRAALLGRRLFRGTGQGPRSPVVVLPTVRL